MNEDLDKDFTVSVLIIDDESTHRMMNERSVRELFKKVDVSEVNIKVATDIKEGLYLLKNQVFHVVLLDRDLGQEPDGSMIDGVEYIPEILSLQPNAQVIVVTSFDDTRIAVRAIQLGASGYLVKNSTPDYEDYRNAQILGALKRSKHEIESKRAKLTTDNKESYYVCKSLAMKRLDTQIHTLAQFSTPVLFLGASGLGKTATAKRLSQLRGRYLKQDDRPFFNINITNISKELADSALFGHEKGAFTGASELKQGLFELASGGDLLLDEIGDASLELQAKLLKVIEEKEFCRVGGKANLKTTARVIFATNKNLEKMVSEGSFREDLYARISALDLTLPSLEDRKEDIPDICRCIIERLSKENKSRRFNYDQLPDDLKEYLQRDHIPFNIRGIYNDLERLMITLPLKNGRINFTTWKSAIGLSKRSVFQTKRPQESLRYKDLEQLPTEFLDPSFPGLKVAKELFERKILEEAMRKYTKNKDIAEVLKLAPSNALNRVNKLKQSRRSSI